ncbi:KdpD-like non-kinase potassium sensor [Terrilactibacillus laevilacticus]|uniref:KdpD-like non-kinase potassium sensor n=1 Tax=Terrilactibacillus laevilacticus TaxID=1380157 RepID=A0ABW5PSX2_9BACI|nr:KdpD-like non-kinase potassium sensor [Terrilactibacillus laevilacticus]
MDKHPYFRRKTPDELLHEIHESNRGKLKLYVGFAPGVGKTYKMLQDAHDMAKEGIDVVIGLIETHSRKETEKQVGTLEHVPLKQIKYRNKVFYELHVEAIIKRKPHVVLVDELAHTNIRGSKNPKRYLDVEEILNAGIDVMSAVNIQHLESVHDIVENITGIKIRERLPDTFINMANEIQLIDTTPITLRKRLAEGKIYAPEKIQQSLTHFFTESNLSALRELVLREIANDVDEKIEKTHGDNYKGPIGVHEKILVCVQYSQTAEKLIRRGWRMANRLKADLYVLTVIDQDPNDMTDVIKQKIKYWEALCEQLHATFLIEQKNKRKPAQVIVNIAKKYYITQILIGQSARTRWEEIVRGSIVNEIMRNTTNIDIHIVADK